MSLMGFENYRWDPSRELEEIGDRFNRIFGRQPARRELGRETMTAATWTPTVDILENDKEYTVKAEIPEVEKKDVKVTVQDGVLTIQGERRKETEQKDQKFHRVERSYGSFSRSFSLPEDAAEDQAAAEFRDGMLFVRLPKTKKPQPKAIEIKVA